MDALKGIIPSGMIASRGSGDKALEGAMLAVWRCPFAGVLQEEQAAEVDGALRAPAAAG